MLSILVGLVAVFVVTESRSRRGGCDHARLAKLAQLYVPASCIVDQSDCTIVQCGVGLEDRNTLIESNLSYYAAYRGFLSKAFSLITKSIQCDWRKQISKWD